MKKRNYSYNCGQPIEEIVVPTTAEIINLFDKLRHNGRIFRVDFIKRTTGEIRTMICRFGVTVYLKGGKKAYNAGDKGLFTVWAFDRQGYRSIPIDNLLSLKTGGTLYQFNTDVAPGHYHPDYIGVYRTIPAATSPLLQNMPN